MTGALKGKEKFKQDTTTESWVSPSATEATAAKGGDPVIVAAARVCAA
jgi:hypothetical protein